MLCYPPRSMHWELQCSPLMFSCSTAASDLSSVHTLHIPGLQKKRNQYFNIRISSCTKILQSENFFLCSMLSLLNLSSHLLFSRLQQHLLPFKQLCSPLACPHSTDSHLGRVFCLRVHHKCYHVLQLCPCCNPSAERMIWNCCTLISFLQPVSQDQALIFKGCLVIPFQLKSVGVKCLSRLTGWAKQSHLLDMKTNMPSHSTALQR